VLTLPNVMLPTPVADRPLTQRSVRETAGLILWTPVIQVTQNISSEPATIISAWETTAVEQPHTPSLYRYC